MFDCPVCLSSIDADEVAFNHHVTAHFEASASASDTSNHGHGDDQDEVLWADETGELVAAYGASQSSTGVVVPACPLCGLSWSFMDSGAKEVHVTLHFDEEPVSKPPPSSKPSPAAGKKARALVQAPSSTGARKRQARDVTWSASSIGTPPKNVTPGVLPILKSLLEKSSTTRSAVLCDPSVLYITSIPLFDLTWGCGYRNFQMVYSTVRPHLPPPINDPPAVVDLQTWIEGAWSAGFDEVGRQQLGGRLVGRSKWIGTADIWVGLSYQGVRSRLADFPEMAQPNHTHSVLIRWVVDYFKPAVAKESNGTAFGNLMATQGATVRMSDKLPLILQHQGHSRTIVGVETLLNGETSKTLPSTIRDKALEANEPPSCSSSSSSEYELPAGTQSAQKRTAQDRKQKGSTRKRIKQLFAVEGAHLKVFRVNMKSLKRNADYQILELLPPSDFAQPLMPPAERAKRKVVVADRIDR